MTLSAFQTSIIKGRNVLNKFHPPPHRPQLLSTIFLDGDFLFFQNYEYKILPQFEKWNGRNRNNVLPFIFRAHNVANHFHRWRNKTQTNFLVVIRLETNKMMGEKGKKQSGWFLLSENPSRDDGKRKQISLFVKERKTRNSAWWKWRTISIFDFYCRRQRPRYDRHSVSFGWVRVIMCVQGGPNYYF